MTEDPRRDTHTNTGGWTNTSALRHTHNTAGGQGAQGEALRPPHHHVRLEPEGPAADGPAAVPHVRPVLRGQRRALVPDVPALCRPRTR